jgi:hypothetical protein
VGFLHERDPDVGFGSSPCGKQRAMDAREAATRQIGGDDAITTRMGAVILPIGVVLIAILEIFHPSKEDPMDFPAVFEEYAHSNVWTTVHLGEYFGFLLLLGGWSPSTALSAQGREQARGLRPSASQLR